MTDIDESVDAFLTASRVLLGVSARSIAPVLDVVTVPQGRVLTVLSNSPTPMRSGDLAEAIGIQPSTFTRTADRMVEAGWISRQENPENRRENLVELTASGRRLVAQVTRRRQREIKRILEGLTAAELKAVLAALDTFNRAAGEPPHDDLTYLGM